MTELLVGDIGGTHARFAVATVADGKVESLGPAATFRVAEHESFGAAVTAYRDRLGRPLPQVAAFAVAAPIAGDVLDLTNNHWAIRPADYGESQSLFINDFAAIGHAVAQLGSAQFRHLCGPERDLPNVGSISIIGPGTGLGVAQLLRSASGDYEVIETLGGHVDFAPLDPVEDDLLRTLRQRFGRVSIERILSGSGLSQIYDALAQHEAGSAIYAGEIALWTAVLSGSDRLAAAALELFCMILGAAAGDTALAQGASAVVIAGGIGLRLADHLPRSGFAARFVAKGRFENTIRDIPVKLITHEQPGLRGAAAAYARRAVS